MTFWKQGIVSMSLINAIVLVSYTCFNVIEITTFAIVESWSTFKTARKFLKQKSNIKAKKTKSSVYYNYKSRKKEKYKFTQDMTYVSGYGIIGLEYRDKKNYVVQNSKSKAAIIQLPKLLLNSERGGNEKKLKRECEGITSYKDKAGIHLLINIKFTGKKGAVYETILK